MLHVARMDLGGVHCFPPGGGSATPFSRARGGFIPIADKGPLERQGLAEWSPTCWASNGATRHVHGSCLVVWGYRLASFEAIGVEAYCPDQLFVSTGRLPLWSKFIGQACG